MLYGTSFAGVGLAEMSATGWQNFEVTMKPNTDQMHTLGHYAVDTRWRSRRKFGVGTVNPDTNEK
jgi:hypothetical protein